MRKRKPKGQQKDECSKCGKELELERKIAGQKYCLLCHAEYMRNHRPKHSELSDEQRKKANARSYLNVYIRRGKIKKQPCEVCGDEEAQAHHDDYDKPLEVRWLCVKHHIKYHQNDLMN